jgi:hydrogenase maturation protease
VNRILIAGIGNIFHGEDTFAVQVLRRLLLRKWPEEVDVLDFGNRAYDLTYALSQGYRCVILVDAAASRGKVPGSVYLIKPEGDSDSGAKEGSLAAGSDSIFQLAQSMGNGARKVVLLGFEPVPGHSGGDVAGWNDPVKAAVPQAVEMVEALAEEMMREELLPEHPGLTLS